jgi:PAS domain S-box-containing protein
MENKKVKYPILENELERLESLYQYDILGMSPESQFDDITKLTSQILNLPICQITLMDKDWQDFISNFGVDMDGNTREGSFCKYTVVQENILEIEDTTKDVRFKDHPFVINQPNIRYYVGAPLLDSKGLAIGTLCGYGMEPNKLNDSQQDILQSLAKTVMRIIRYRKINSDQRKYVNIFKLNQDLLCIISKDGYFKLVNPAFTNLLGWSEVELLKSPLKKIIHPDDYFKVMREFKKMKPDKVTVGFNCRLLSKNKKIIGVDWSCFLDSSTSTIVASGHDMTSLVNTKMSLEKAVKVKDEFMSNMSHEIRTPLTSIIGFTDLLTKSELNDVQKSQAETVTIAANHLMNIVNDVLDVYKLESGKLTLENKSINLKDLLFKIERLYINSANQKGISLIFNLDNNISHQIFGDETRLIQILSNLISNAIKFTNQGSVEVTVVNKVQIKGKMTTLFTIKDSGIGISPSQKNKIFERFAQAKKNTSRLYGGTGLGLNITKMLLDLHHSKIDIESEINKGSSFKFEIDFELDLKNKLSATQKLPFQSKKLTGLKILLVEDNEHLQLLTKTYLKKYFGIVTVANNGIDALEKLKKEYFDVIVMDIQMPKMDGHTTTIEIRNSLNLNTPIIGCSANSNLAEKERCIKNGMTDYISKPYTEDILITSILKNIVPKNEYYDDFKVILNELRKKEGNELVNEFEKIFKTRAPKDIKELTNSYEKRNIEEIYKKAHFLSTTFCTLRFEKGELLTNKIDLAYKAGNEHSVFDLAEKLIIYLKDAIVKI